MLLPNVGIALVVVFVFLLWVAAIIVGMRVVNKWVIFTFSQI